METQRSRVQAPPGADYASLAQSVEHQTFNLRAAGSSPARGFVIHRTLNDVIWTHSSVVEQLTADQSVPSSNLGGSFRR